MEVVEVDQSKNWVKGLHWKAMHSLHRIHLELRDGFSLVKLRDLIGINGINA